MSSDLSEKYNLMEIAKEKIEQLDENRLGPGEHVGLLYGMPIIIRSLGKNTPDVQNKVSELSKYNHPSLALNYGYLLEKKDKEPTEDDEVYIVRELVKGENFNNINKHHTHDKLVLIYKLVCLLEFLHSFDVYYIFLHPSKIIITDDLEIKVIDNIKINEEWGTQLNISSLNDESRFISPDLYNSFNEKSNNLLQFDLYSLGCLIFYALSGQMPWYIPGEENISKEKILELWAEKKTFLKDKEYYPEEMQRFYDVVKKLITYSYDSSETLRLELEKTKEIERFNKDGHLEFDFKEKCEQVIVNINNLVLEIDKLFDESHLKKHMNTIHQTKLKFTNNLDIDETKPKNSLKEYQIDHKIFDKK